ncbi:MAG: hypothetical protein IKL03_06085 [Bacteroidaceae bacterium]|nr:hypothetical protein [Bacteroidaceae bacterium]
MATTVNVICYKSKTLSNGEHPIMVRISKDGKKKYVSVGISIKSEFWNFDKNEPKRNCLPSLGCFSLFLVYFSRLLCVN